MPLPMVFSWNSTTDLECTLTQVEIALNSNVFLSDIFGVQLILAGSEGGHIFLWDLRGGRSSAAFVTSGEVFEVLLSPHAEISVVLVG